MAGSINVRDASFTGKFDTNILGGDIFAQTMNIFSGNGITNLAVSNLSPVLNVTTGDAYISTSSSNLNLGTLNFSGDPVIQSGNDMVISGDQNGNGPLTVSAPQGSILSDGSVVKIDGDGNVNYYALNDVNLKGVKDISSSSSVSIVAQTGSVYLPDASISAQAVVPVSIGQTGIIPTSVQIAALHDVTIGGGISSPGGSVIIRAGSAVSNGIIYPPSSAGTIQVGSIDLSSKANPGIGYIELGAGTNVNAGSLNGNGGFIHVYAPNGIVTLTAGSNPKTGEMMPVIVNNAASEYLRSLSYTLIEGQNGVTIKTGGFQPAAGDIQAGSSLLQLFSSAGTLSLVGGGAPIVINVSALKGGNGYSGSMSLIAPIITTDSPVKLVANGDGTGAGGGIDVETGSALVVGATGFTAYARGGSAGGDGGRVSFAAAGGITADGSVIDVSAFGNGNGGFIGLSSNQVVSTFFATPYGVSGPMQISGVFNANGSGTGNGGTVYISTSNQSSDLTIGGGTTISAQSGKNGGNGGSVEVQSGHNLAVATSAVHVNALGQNGDGGSVEFDCNLGGTDGNLVVNGDINVSGVGTGNGGNITLDPISASAVVVGGGGGSGGGSTSPGSITVNGNLIANAGAVGKGGEIDLEAHIAQSATAQSYNLANITVGSSNKPVRILSEGGSTSGDGGSIIVAGDGNVTLNTSLISASARGTGNGGTINLDPAGTVGGGGGSSGSSGAEKTLSLSGNITATGGTTAGVGGDITLKSTTVVLNGKTVSIDVSADGEDNKAGTVNLIVNSVQSNTASLTVLANGKNGAYGGEIDLSANDSNSAVTLGTVTLSATTSASGSTVQEGGVISLSANQDLSIVNGTLNVSHTDTPGSGGTITINAGTSETGQFSFAGTMSANGRGNGGTGGNITLTSPSFNFTGPVSLKALGGKTGSGTGGARGGQLFVTSTDASAALSVGATNAFSIDVSGYGKNQNDLATASLTGAGDVIIGQYATITASTSSLKTKYAGVINIQSDAPAGTVTVAGNLKVEGGGGQTGVGINLTGDTVNIGGPTNSGNIVCEALATVVANSKLNVSGKLSAHDMVFKSDASLDVNIAQTGVVQSQNKNSGVSIAPISSIQLAATDSVSVTNNGALSGFLTTVDPTGNNALVSGSVSINNSRADQPLYVRQLGSTGGDILIKSASKLTAFGGPEADNGFVLSANGGKIALTATSIDLGVVVKNSGGTDTFGDSIIQSAALSATSTQGLIRLGAPMQIAGPVNISGQTGIQQLNSLTKIQITSPVGSSASPTGLVSLNSLSGNIGSGRRPIQIDAPFVSVESGGNAFIKALSGLTVNSSTVTKRSH